MQDSKSFLPMIQRTDGDDLDIVTFTLQTVVMSNQLPNNLGTYHARLEDL